MHINNEVKLTAEIEALEKKLAEQTNASINLHKLLEVANVNVVKANSNAEHFEREWYLRGDALEELIKQLAAARQQGFEEGKQAGRDEYQKELSEQEPFCHFRTLDGKPDWDEDCVSIDTACADTYIDDAPDRYGVVALIPRPNKPTKE